MVSVLQSWYDRAASQERTYCPFNCHSFSVYFSRLTYLDSDRIWTKGLHVFLLFCLMGGAPVFGQNAVVRGFVTDASDGEPLQGVNVILKQDSIFVTGAATDRDGFFIMTNVVAGAYMLQASFIGYTNFTRPLSISGKKLLTLDISLEAGNETLDEVVIESDRISGSTRVTAGMQRVTSEEIKMVPGPDVSPDLATYLSTLPGVISTGDRGGQHFIRGGEPAQNIVLLDGMYIFHPFHMFGFYSAFT